MSTYTYTFGKDFCPEFVGDRRFICILEPCEVDDLKKENDLIDDKLYCKTHADGWTISAYPEADYFVWITTFTANHAVYGTIIGDLQTSIITCHPEAFTHFTKNHKIETYDLYNI